MSAMSTRPNLKEQRRAATREALRSAALSSFAERGFANVTVTELAQEAGVTERTFFRHFPTKEAVLFRDFDTQTEWLRAALSERDPSEPLIDAVLASIASFPHDLEVVRQAALARTELISADRIAGHLRVVQASFAEVITDYAKQRTADLPYPDLTAEVAGAVIAAALVCAVEGWGRDGCTDDIGERTAAAMELVRTGLAVLH
jgi:AcrR family transcriptional regulator